MTCELELTDAHLVDCAACRDVIVLARALPVDLPARVERDLMRAAILDRARPGALRPRGTEPPPVVHQFNTVPISDPSFREPRGSKSRNSTPSPFLIFAAALALVPSVAPPASDERAAPVAHSHGTISPHAGARYRSTTAPDEIVRLEHGTITIDVAPMHAGERFRVVVGDAEVEVRGTRFTVSASGDRLVAVTVQHGRVDVRPRDRAVASLVAGQSWRQVAEPPREVPAVAPPPPPPPPPKQVTRANPARVAPDRPPPARTPIRLPEELAYEDGWTAMRAGNFARASAAFARVFLIAPDSTLAEDASFWRAVALARGQRAGEAATAFRDFLAT